PIENVYILHDEHEDSEAFVLAIAGGRRFVGSWADRSPAPGLADEIPAKQGGWAAYRRKGGRERGTYPPDPKCRALALHHNTPPSCLPWSRFDDHSAFMVSGSWELTLELLDATRSRLIARDVASEREEHLALPCAEPSFATTALARPRALMVCSGQAIVEWTPWQA